MWQGDAEKILIGSVILSRGAYLDDCHLIVTDFQSEKNRQLFTVLRKMRADREGIDAFTVGSKLPELAVYVHEPQRKHRLGKMLLFMSRSFLTVMRAGRWLRLVTVWCRLVRPRILMWMLRLTGLVTRLSRSQLAGCVSR